MGHTEAMNDPIQPITLNQRSTIQKAALLALAFTLLGLLNFCIAMIGATEITMKPEINGRELSAQSAAVFGLIGLAGNHLTAKAAENPVKTMDAA
jgi:uncharacterized membrane protein YuzA (DUF378 family)